MANKQTAEVDEALEGQDQDALKARFDRPGRRSTDDELPAQEAAVAIKEAAEARRAVRRMGEHSEASLERQQVETFDLLDGISKGKVPDFDKLRKKRKETRAKTAQRLAAERNQTFLQASRTKDESTYQYALICPHCDRPGVFFVCNPIGKLLYHQDWFSVIKKKDEPWHMNMIPCQHCFIDRGLYLGMAYTRAESKDASKGSAFRVAGSFARLIVKMAKDPEVRAKEGLLDGIVDRVREIGIRETALANAAEGA